MRGLVNKELNPEVMEFLGKGYGTFLSRRRIKDAVVGRDNRLTGEIYEKSFISGLRSCGIDVVDFGLGMTQIMYFAQYFFRSKGGCFITASHNPAEFNGMKLSVGFSQTMISEEIQEFREITQLGRYSTSAKEGSLSNYDIFPDYKKDILKRIGILKKFKVVVDCCNAAPGKFMPEILRDAGCEVIEQNTNLDGNFPSGTPDPTEKTVQERLAKRVVKEKAALGFSYDSDGDRMGIVDEKGNLIWNDILLAIFSMDILEYLPGSKIIFNTLCSKVVPETIKLYKGIPVMCKTGHSFIKEKVAEERSPFGGELSGHFFFADNFYGHDDGAYSSLRLLSYLTRKNLKLSEAVSSLPQYISSPEIKLGCADEVKFPLISEDFAKDFRSLYPKAKFFTLDGIRMETEDKMANIRASQNGPYITVKYEAKTKSEYENLRKNIRNILEKYPQVDWTKGVNTDSL